MDTDTRPEGPRPDDGWDAVPPSASRRLRLFLLGVPVVTLGLFLLVTALLR